MTQTKYGGCRRGQKRCHFGMRKTIERHENIFKINRVRNQKHYNGYSKQIKTHGERPFVQGKLHEKRGRLFVVKNVRF